MGVKNLFQVLIITGVFACCLAFWNTSCRYLFAMGREGILPRVLGRTHAKHKSPFVAAFVMLAFTTAVFSLFAFGPAASGTLETLGLQRSDAFVGVRRRRHLAAVPGEHDPVPDHGRRVPGDHVVLHPPCPRRLPLVQDRRSADHRGRLVVLRHLPHDEEPRGHHVLDRVRRLDPGGAFYYSLGIFLIGVVLALIYKSGARKSATRPSASSCTRRPDARPSRRLWPPCDRRRVRASETDPDSLAAAGLDPTRSIRSRRRCC